MSDRVSQDRGNWPDACHHMTSGRCAVCQRLDVIAEICERQQDATGYPALTTELTGIVRRLATGKMEPDRAQRQVEKYFGARR